MNIRALIVAPLLAALLSVTAIGAASAAPQPYGTLSEHRHGNHQNAHQGPHREMDHREHRGDRDAHHKPRHGDLRHQERHSDRNDRRDAPRHPDRNAHAEHQPRPVAPQPQDL